MNYEQKYKEALEKARQLCAYPTSKPFISDLKNLFPELSESEDEKIREALISVLKSDFENDTTIHDISVGDIIAWLEKQGEPQVRTGIEWVNTIDDACDKRYSEEYAEGEYCHEQSFKWGFQEGVDWLEKKGNERDIHLMELKAKAYDDAKERMSYAYNKNRVPIGFINEIFPDIKLYEKQCEPKDYNSIDPHFGKPINKVEQKQTIEISFGAKDSELQEATYHIPGGYHAEINGNEVVIKKGE